MRWQKFLIGDFMHENDGNNFVCCLFASRPDNISYFSWQDEPWNWVLANTFWNLNPHFTSHQNSATFGQNFLFGKYSCQEAHLLGFAKMKKKKINISTGKPGSGGKFISW
uniref:Uncharacterized protein n=1 Tax=Nothoprocta perdicaria TaxID=30464 RepID=A0A8C7E9H4_NOTPE